MSFHQLFILLSFTSQRNLTKNREAEESFVAHGNPTARVVWVQ